MDNQSLDLFLILLFAAVQWRISRLILAAYPRVWARRAILLFDALLVVSYALTFPVVPDRLHLPSDIAMVVGAGALAYFMTATGVLGIYYLLRAVGKHLGAETNPGRRRALHTAGSVLLASPLAVMGYGALIQRTDFHVREIDIPLPGLPQDLDGLRLLQLSDIHLSAFLSEGELARVIDACNELRAHAAFFTGDLVSGRSDPLDAGIRQLARLRSDSGIFGCLGNHERFIRAEAYTARQAARAGIQFLRGEARQLRFGNSALNIAGMDFQSHRDRETYLAGAERLIAPGAVNLLLQHNPDVFPAAAAKGYNLLLAGHTHGGQVTVEILDRQINPARFLTPYVYGLYRLGASAAYVTRGIGTIGIPARIGAPPEISLLRLRKV